MPVITIPNQVLSSGLFISPSATVTSTARTATLQLVMPNSTERSDPLARLDLTVDVSNDGIVWKSFVMAGWRGAGGNTAKGSTVLNPAPAIGLGWAGDWTGKQVRITALLNRSMTIGATVTV